MELKKYKKKNNIKKIKYKNIYNLDKCDKTKERLRRSKDGRIGGVD